MPVKLAPFNPKAPWANHIPGTTEKDDPPASPHPKHANFIPASEDALRKSKEAMAAAGNEQEVLDEIEIRKKNRIRQESDIKAKQHRLDIQEEALAREQKTINEKASATKRKRGRPRKIPAHEGHIAPKKARE